MPFSKRNPFSARQATPTNNSVPIGLPVLPPTFSHKGPDGHWTKYNAAHSEMIAEAMEEQPAGGSLTIPNSPFVVKWGSHATSAKMPTAPKEAVIQVNVATGNTHIVRQDAPQVQAECEEEPAITVAIPVVQGVQGEHVALFPAKLQAARQSEWAAIAKREAEAKKQAAAKEAAIAKREAEAERKAAAKEAALAKSRSEAERKAAVKEAAAAEKQKRKREEEKRRKEREERRRDEKEARRQMERDWRRYEMERDCRQKRRPIEQERRQERRAGAAAERDWLTEARRIHGNDPDYSVMVGGIPTRINHL